MKTIDKLQKGDIIYFVRDYQVRHYKYLCVHPTGHGNYHILIDECEEPKRIYYSTLEIFLSQNLNTYQEAKIYLAENLEITAKWLRDEPKSE